MSPLSYSAVQERLEQIEEDLAQRQPTYEAAAESLARKKRDVEHRLATIRLSLRFGTGEKDTVQTREAKALTSLAAAGDGLYEEWVEAEATFAGQKAAVDVLEKRASIGQSLLRGMQRETGG